MSRKLLRGWRHWVWGRVGLRHLPTFEALRRPLGFQRVCLPAASPAPCSTPRARAAQPSGFLPLFLQNLYLELKMLPHTPYKEVNTELLCAPVTLGYLCRTKEKTTVPTRPSLGN